MTAMQSTTVIAQGLLEDVTSNIWTISNTVGMENQV